MRDPSDEMQCMKHRVVFLLNSESVGDRGGRAQTLLASVLQSSGLAKEGHALTLLVLVIQRVDNRGEMRCGVLSTESCFSPQP